MKFLIFFNFIKFVLLVRVLVTLRSRPCSHSKKKRTPCSLPVYVSVLFLPFIALPSIVVLFVYVVFFIIVQYFIFYFSRKMPLPPQVEKIIQDFDKVLHQPNQVTKALAFIEEKTGVKRLHIAGGEHPF